MSQDHFAFTPTVRALPATTPFVGPEAIERQTGQPFRVRLGANESVFGPSPKAREAMRAAIDESWCYGDPEGLGLRSDLARFWGLPESNIQLGAGIDGLLQTLVRTMVSPGTPVVTSRGAYPTFNYHVAACGGDLRFVPYRDDHEDLDALLAEAKRIRPPLVYLSNPDNPMGTWHKAGDIEAFASALPDETLLLLDEAYAEFAPAQAVPEMRVDAPKMIRMRTFSKVYGMAGQRIGYALAHAEVITAMSKIRNHFEVNRIAQIGARAALADQAFTDKTIKAVAEGREAYVDLAARLNLQAIPSATNFVAIDVGGEDRASALLKALQAEGIFIRMPGVAPLNRCIRVTVGTTEDRAIFAEALETCLSRIT